MEAREAKLGPNGDAEVPSGTNFFRALLLGIGAMLLASAVVGQEGAIKSQQPPRASKDCLRHGAALSVVGRVSKQPLLMANGDQRQVTVVDLPRSICVWHEMNDPRRLVPEMISRLQVEGARLAPGAKQRVTGQFLTGNVTQSYLVEDVIWLEAFEPKRPDASNVVPSQSAILTFDPRAADERRSFQLLKADTIVCMRDSAIALLQMGLREQDAILAQQIMMCGAPMFQFLVHLNEQPATEDEARLFVKALALQQLANVVNK